MLFFCLASLSCRARWEVVDETHRIRRVDGKLVAIEERRGDVVLEVVPERSDVLARGQKRLHCQIPSSRRAHFGLTLKRLRLGQELRISGHLMRDNYDGEHYLRPVTGLIREPRR